MQTIEVQEGPQKGEIVAHLLSLGMSQAHAEELAEMLIGPLMARDVGNSVADNTRVRSPSMKMRAAVICESFSVEYAYCLQLEHDPEVLWYSTQPCQLLVSGTRKDGRRYPREITPDFLVVENSRVYFVEGKAEAHLQEKAQSNPTDWIRREDGTWRFLPGESNRFGIPFMIVSDASLPRKTIQNMEVLHPTYISGATPDPDGLARLISAVAEAREITLEVLQQEHDIDLGLIYQAILHGEVHCLLDKELLTNPHRFRLFSSAERAASAHDAKPIEGLALTVGGTLMLDDTPWMIIGIGRDRVTLKNETGGVQWLERRLIPATATVLNPPQRSTLQNFRDEDVREAVSRLELIRRWSLRGHRPPAQKRASYYRWRKLYKQAEETLGEGLLGLIPDPDQNQGKRPRVYPQQIFDKMDESQEKILLTAIAPSIQAGYAQFRDELKNSDQLGGMPIPSYETYRRRYLQRSASEVVRSRFGKRMANAIAPTLAQTKGEKPIRGLYPWHIVECDHTPADILLVDENGEPLHGQTWLTVLVDTFSRKPLVWRLTLRGKKGEPTLELREEEDPEKRKGEGFNPEDQATPSAKRLASLLGELAFVYNQFPTRMHLDNGSDFRSAMLETTLSAYGTAVSNRAPGNPRRGSVVESFLNCVNSGLWHRLAGNKEVEKYHRHVTKSVKPSTHARYTLEHAHAILDHFMLDVFPHQEHSGIQRTPEQAYTEGMASVPAIIHVAYDDRLKMQLTTEAGMPVMQPGKGVFVNGRYYWNELFDMQMLQGQKLQVRDDRWDLSRVWVLIGGKWHMAISNDFVDMSAMDELRRRTLSEEKHFSRIASAARKKGVQPFVKPDVPLSPKQDNQPAEVAEAQPDSPFAGLSFGEQEMQEAA